MKDSGVDELQGRLEAVALTEGTFLAWHNTRILSDLFSDCNCFNQYAYSTFEHRRVRVIILMFASGIEKKEQL